MNDQTSYRTASEWVRDLEQQLEDARRMAIITALLPYAAPRLPEEVLACFDEQQRQIRPLPWQVERRNRHLQLMHGAIPQQRRPVDEAVNSRG